MEENKNNGVPSTSSATKTILSLPPSDSQLVPYTTLGDVLAVEEEKRIEFCHEFPIGYRFAPTDDELLEAYLHNKVLGRPLPMDNIKEVEIYKYNPHDLAGMYLFGADDKKECYFFTPRDRKYPNGVRPNRAAGDGYWKATGADKKIMHPQTNEELGYKKTLVFYYGKPGKGTKSNWIQHEYRIQQTASLARQNKHDMKLEDVVLVRIYEKIGRNSKAKANANDNEHVPNAESSQKVEQGHDIVSPGCEPYNEDANDLSPDPDPTDVSKEDMSDVCNDVDTTNICDEDMDELKALLSPHGGIDGDQALGNFMPNSFLDWSNIGCVPKVEAEYSLNTLDLGPLGSNAGMFDQMNFDNCYNIQPQGPYDFNGDLSGLIPNAYHMMDTYNHPSQEFYPSLPRMPDPSLPKLEEEKGNSICL